MTGSGLKLSLCFAAGLLIAASPVLAQTPQEHVELAEQAFDRSDIIGAMAYYRKAAEAGYVPAINRLAYLLDKSEANEEAVEWYQKSVAKDDPEAQYELARMYAIGEGIEKNIDQAYLLFTQSAQQRYAPAIRVLALAFEHGKLGQRIDYEQVRYWLQRGQQANDYWSIKHLASAYKKGELGLRIDKQKAKELESLLEPLLKKDEQ